MNDSENEINNIEVLLSKNQYLPNKKIALTLFLSEKLEKPILVEGPPGTGKTELSKAVARAFNKDFFRIQCYEGITFEQIVGEWNYQKQLLNLEMSKLKDDDNNIFNEEFFIKRPLLSAFINDKSSILLIDEIDKADEEFESFLLQALGEKQITINDLGTFDLKNDLQVFLTSNSQRNLLDETKDRCLYLFIDYPDFEREMKIVKTIIPSASEKLVSDIVSAIQKIRNMQILKKPSIRATIDWVKTMLYLNYNKLDEDSFNETLDVALKSKDDVVKVKKDFRF